MNILHNSQKFSVGYFSDKAPGYGSVGTLQNLTLKYSFREALDSQGATLFVIPTISSIVDVRECHHKSGKPLQSTGGLVSKLCSRNTVGNLNLGSRVGKRCSRRYIHTRGGLLPHGTVRVGMNFVLTGTW